MTRRRKKAPAFWDEEQLAGSPVVFFETDADGRLTYGAHQLAAVLGRKAHDVAGRPWAEMVVEGQRDVAGQLWDRLTAGEAVRGRELSFEDAQGQARPFSVSLFPVCDRRGTLLGARALAADLAVQKGLAYALEAAEERFSVLFRESSDPILILSLQGEILSANPSFERLTGLRSDELFCGERGWRDFVHPEDLPRLMEALERCRTTQREEVVEFRLRHREGYVLWFEQSHSLLHDEHGRPRGLMAVARDITRRKERELRLLEEAETLQRRHERAQELIAKLTLFMSKLAELPAEPEAFLGGVCELLFETYRPLAVVISARDREPVVFPTGRRWPAAAVDEAGRLRCSALCEHVEKEGVPLYRTSLDRDETFRDDPLVRALNLRTYLGAPLRDAQGVVRGTLAVLDTQARVFDHLDVELLTVAALQVAARLRAEEQERLQRELEDHLRQAQKMEAVGMLAGGIAHDFNNLLSGILGFSSLLKSKAAPGSDLARHLELIEKSAAQASELTRRLLSFSRRTHFAKEFVPLNTVVQEVLEIVRPSLRRGIRLDTELTPQATLVHGDRSQLAQVVLNLCLNAIEAMAERGGTLTVRTERRPLTAYERGILIAPRDGDYVCLSVADTGRGMDPEVQEHIFEPFFTTKEKSGGTGLGLSIVYGIVSNHGGDIRVESAEGRGSVFHVYLPAHEAAAPAAALGRRLEGTETILIVEDENIVRQMVAEILRTHGYEPLCAPSGEEAVAWLRKRRGEVHLVLLDLIMPGMDGEQTFYALREVDPNVPILLTSGFAQSERCARLLAAGARGLVRKPYTSHGLLAQIRAALGDKGHEGGAARAGA